MPFVALAPDRGSSGYVFATHYGAAGNGIVDDTAAVQAALDAAAGGAVFFPEGTYRITSGITIPSPCVLEFASTNAVLKFTGTGSAVSIRNERGVEWRSGCIDISGADASAVGLHVRGLWFGSFTGLKVLQGPATSTGVLVETSETGGNNFGSYLLRFIGLDLKDGAGAYGFRTNRTEGDAVSVTHLLVEGGWFAKKDQIAHFAHANSGRVLDTVLDESPGDGLHFENCADWVLSPGEAGRLGGHAINFGAGNSAMTLLVPNKIGTNLAGYVNEANHKPSVYAKDALRLLGSRTDASFFTELRNDYTYAASTKLIASGGGTPHTVLSWGDGEPLRLTQGRHHGVQVEDVDGRVGFYGATPVAKQANVPVTAEAIHAALVALGLIA